MKNYGNQLGVYGQVSQTMNWRWRQTVATAIIGLQGFFTLKGQAAMGVGSIEYPAAERKRLARL